MCQISSLIIWKLEDLNVKFTMKISTTPFLLLASAASVDAFGSFNRGKKAAPKAVSADVSITLAKEVQQTTSIDIIYVGSFRFPHQFYSYDRL
jgi:hypothetical protein